MKERGCNTAITCCRQNTLLITIYTAFERLAASATFEEGKLCVIKWRTIAISKMHVFPEPVGALCGGEMT